MKQPFGFSWVIPDLIAAMGRPRDLYDELAYLKDQKIDLIISLTRTPIAKSFLEEFEFEYLHIPIRDFAAPSQKQSDSFVSAIIAASEAGKRAAIHCQAGMGRTGTMISCYLVKSGMTAREAINHVRRLRPGSIETADQELAVYEYERRIKAG